MLKDALLKLGALLWFVGAILVSTAINAAANAVGVWIVLEQFDYSLPGFWSYIIVGFGLVVILTPLSGSSD